MIWIRDQLKHADGAREEIDDLAKFIIAEVPGEPSQSEGAGTTAIRIICRLTDTIRNVVDGAGVVLDDERLKYIGMQINREDWRALVEIVEAKGSPQSD